MPLFRKTRGTAHWSVDFVEHLRLVHFTLVTLAVALLILIASTPDPKISSALTQATELVELQDRWAQIRGSLYRHAAREAEQGVGSTWYATITSPTLQPHKLGVGLRLTDDEFNKYAAWKFLGTSMQDAPSTISEFRKWWADLHQASSVVFLQATKNPEHCVANITVNGQHSVQPTCDLGADESHYRVDAEVISDVEAHDDLGIPFSGDNAFMKGRVNFDGNTHDVVVTVLVSFDTASVGIDESALQVIFPDWRKGSYESAFKELASVSEGLDNIPLKDLPGRIADLVPRGEQALEALGLKVPAALLTRWGIVLLLATQFYFWLHLHEFKSKVDVASPGLDVAWIGVYRSRIAFATMIASACLGPAVAVAVLSFRMPRDLPKAWGPSVALGVAIVAAVLGLTLAIGTGERLFRLRAMIRRAHA